MALGFGPRFLVYAEERVCLSIKWKNLNFPLDISSRSNSIVIAQYFSQSFPYAEIFQQIDFSSSVFHKLSLRTCSLALAIYLNIYFFVPILA